MSKYLIVLEECDKSLETYTEITAILESFHLYKVVSEYAETIKEFIEKLLDI